MGNDESQKKMMGNGQSQKKMMGNGQSQKNMMGMVNLHNKTPFAYYRTTNRP